MLIIKLFLTFFKIGAFTFGGGYAMLPLIQEEVIKNSWASLSELINFVAVSESTPGPFAINMATYIGTVKAGIFGAIFATLGVVLPSFGIILAISYVLDAFQDLKVVQYAFNGIRAGVLALLFKALWTMFKKSPKGWAAYVVMGGAFLATAILKINVLYVIIGCALFGLITATFAKRRAEK